VLGDISQDLVALEVMDVPQHRVLGGLCSHALEVFRRESADRLAAVGADDPTRDLERPGLRVELHPHVARRIECAHVGRGERCFHRVEHLLERDADLRTERSQRFREAFR